MSAMATPPESTKSSLQQRLTAHARAALAADPPVPDPTPRRIRLRRRRTRRRHRGAARYLGLRYAGSANMWGFAIYLWSKEGYEDSFLPNGHQAGTPEQALDCAAGLYLNNPAAWLPPTN